MPGKISCDGMLLPVGTLQVTLVAGMSEHSLHPVKDASLDHSPGMIRRRSPHMAATKSTTNFSIWGTERRFCDDGSYHSQVIFLRFTCHQYEHQCNLLHVVVFLEEGMYREHLVEGFADDPECSIYKPCLHVSQEAELDICGEEQMPLRAHTHVLTEASCR